jgi:heptosyltransferase-2
MNILVIRLSSMGDVVLTTPALSFLSDAYPSASITLMVGEPYAGLFQHDPRIDRLLSIGKGAAPAGVLRDGRWDRIVDLQNNARSRRIVRMLPRRGAVSRFDKLHLKRGLLLAFRINLFDRASDVVRRYARAAGWDPARHGALPRLRIQVERNDAALQGIVELSDGSPLLALAPFSAWKNKEWPADRYAAVGRHFAGQGWRVAVFGGPEDIMAGEALVREIGSAAVPVAGKLALERTASLLARCKLALGNDTGLTHLARACGVRTGMICGATSWQWGFYPAGDPPFRIFEAPCACRPCHAHGGNRCRFGNRPCLLRIMPQDVVRGLSDLDAPVRP